jgi:hypothetical protein
MEMEEKESKIIWDSEIKAWVDLKTGRLIAPRMDEDGIDFFFVESKNEKEARARYCSGEGYWAFPFTEEEIKEIKRDYKELMQYVAKLSEEEIKKLLD